ncbi:uncharacterized protein LOC141675179 [Apium graveolens]|uniref:uncharacterized protein LOC141675179 n=1 Tax=Apium graveolens TaxID=4045 RepID=UPI003D7B1892
MQNPDQILEKDQNFESNYQELKMVLWEITLATAYFLGLKKTYKLALKMQRRVVSHKHPKTRQFLYRRTRAVFDMVIRVHKKIQERDIEVGRNVGNWILRWLDKMKPSAEIRGGQPPSIAKSDSSVRKQLNSSSHQKTAGDRSTCSVKNGDRESGRQLFSSTRMTWRKQFPNITKMMPGISSQHRHMSICGPQVLKPNYGSFGSERVIRKDIMEWMVRK